MPEPSNKAPIELAAPYAVKAWQELCGNGATPRSVECLKWEKKSWVYRLTGAGPDGGNVIAKRCRTATADLERTIHEEILPQLPVTHLAFYGSVEEEAFTWLFLEDAGGERYSPDLPEHRGVGGRWLGLLHVSAAPLAAVARLADRGPSYHLQRLRAARQRLEGSVSNRLLTNEEVGWVRGVIDDCNVLESRWSGIEQACADVPATLVHGDFRRKNVRLRRDPDGSVVLPLDWETAGRAAPAGDLTRVDLDAYWSIVRNVWPTVDRAAVERLASVGRIFQRLAAIDWDSAGLGYDQRILLLRPATSMGVHWAGLAEEMDAAGLSGLAMSSC